MRTFLEVHWLGSHLPVQGTWVRSLVWEDSTRLGATKHHKYGACTLEPENCNYLQLACMPQLQKPKHLEPELHSKEKPLLTATREIPHTGMKTQYNRKKKGKKLENKTKQTQPTNQQKTMKDDQDNNNNSCHLLKAYHAPNIT